jgi:hypothetical protein
MKFCSIFIMPHHKFKHFASLLIKGFPVRPTIQWGGGWRGVVLELGDLNMTNKQNP